MDTKYHNQMHVKYQILGANHCNKAKKNTKLQM